MRQLTDVEAAWLGGLFEGECCISVNVNRPGKVYHKVRIEMTDQDVIERVRELIGPDNCTVTEPKTRQPHHKQSWMLAIHKQEVIKGLLSQLLPYLGQRRRAKALQVLAPFV